MIIIWYIVATLFVSIMFGLTLLTSNLFKKLKITFLSKYIFQLWFLISFFIMNFITPIKVPILNLTNIISIKNIIILLSTVILTTIIVAFEKTEKHNMIEWFLLGVSMEIPQRLFMQTFFIIVITSMNYEKANIIAIVMNTVLWVQFILIQDFMSGKQINRTIINKLIASACFSLGIGYLYASSGCIILTMLGHGMERILSELLHRQTMRKVSI